jgi:hypothetical protein
MTSICVVGNSHAACFKRAWEQLKSEFRDVCLTFFAHRGAELSALEARGSLLVPTNPGLQDAIRHTSGGRSEIDPSIYDAMLLVGLNVRLYPIGSRHASDGLVRQWLSDYVPTSVAADVLGKLRSISSIPIFAAHQPLEACAEPEVDLGTEVYRAHAATVADIFRRQAAEFLLQPERTITNRHYTKQMYLKGARSLDVGDLPADAHPTDRTHMNMEFGEICLSEYLPAILAR